MIRESLGGRGRGVGVGGPIPAAAEQPREGTGNREQGTRSAAAEQFYLVVMNLWDGRAGAEPIKTMGSVRNCFDLRSISGEINSILLLHLDLHNGTT